MNRYQRKVIWTARALAFALPLAYLLLLVAMLVSRPKSAVVTFPPMVGLMASGTTELKSDGSLQLDKTGAVRVANGSTDKCCCPCAACDGCAEGPCSATVTISGVGACSTCHGTSSGPPEIASGSVNGTYDAPRDPGPGCKFITHISGMSVDSYSPSAHDCLGSISTTFTDSILTITRTSNTLWGALIALSTTADVFDSSFASGTVPSGDCTASLTFANTLDCSSPATSHSNGNGGTIATTFHYS